jgi:hypothetical protein
MTLDEAIQHAREKADEMRDKGCTACEIDHRQLYLWLTELKRLQKLLGMPDICTRWHRDYLGRHSRDVHFHADGRNPPLAQTKLTRPIPPPAPPRGIK